MKTVEIASFKGVRNDLDPERFEKGDLQVGENIELDETGKPQRRAGITEIDDVATHSLWAEDELCFGVRNGSLHQLLPDMTWVDKGIAIPGQKVTYFRQDNDVFFSDEVVSGIMGIDGYRPLGIAVPPKPTCAIGFGSLAPGKYLFTMTYVRTDGKESGASPVQSVDVQQGDGLSFTLPVSSDPFAVLKNLYISDCNGEVPYLIATLPNSDLTASVTALPTGRTVAVRTLRMGPPPAGRICGVYRGRLYVAENNYLWYSQPYEFELVHRAMNFIGLTSPVRTFAPVSDGIFVGSDEETLFFQGMEPKSFTMTKVAPYGTIQGTEALIPNEYFGKGDLPKPVPAWMSKKGVCVGFEGGMFMNLTGGKYLIPSTVKKGASLFKVRSASPQLVTPLFS